MKRFTLTLAMVSFSAFAAAQTGFQVHKYAAPADNHLIARDLNRDNKPDLIQFGGPLTVRLNNGSGGFGASLPVAGANASAAAVADFNKDGLPDIAACQNPSSGGGATVAIYLNHGGGSFTSSYSTTVPYTCTNVMAGDINRDGKVDLVVSGYGSNPAALITFFGDGSGKLGAPVTQNPSVAARKDPQNITNCYLGSAVGGIFQPKTGRFDLILFGGCAAGPTNGGTMFYATSDTTGHYTLTELMEDVRQWDYNLPYVADVDSTGLPDVVLVGYQVGPHGSWDSQLDFLVNKGGGVFALKEIFDENSYAASYDNTVFSGAAADFNGDKIDDAVAGFTQSPSDCCVPDVPGIAVLNGLGHFTYSESQRWKIGGYSYATVASDFNADGRPDIATLFRNNNTGVTNLVVYLNQGGSAVCTAPSSPGVHVCSPRGNAGTYTSPVSVVATGKGASGTVQHMEVWVDSQKLANFPGATVNTKVGLTAGPHQVAVVEVDSKGAYIKSSPVSIYVQ